MVPFTSVVLSNVAGFEKPKPCISWLSVSLLWNHCRDFRSFGSEALIGALQETHKPPNSPQNRSRLGYGLNTIRTDSAWCSIKYCGHPTSSSVGYRRPLRSQPLCSTRFFPKLSSLDIKRCLEMRPTIPFSPRQNAACRSRATPG